MLPKMELCTNTQSAISILSNNNQHHRFLATTISPALVRTKSSPSFKQTTVSCSGYGLRSRILYYTANILPKATSEETASGADQYVVDKRDGATAVEDVPTIEKNVYNESVAPEALQEESPVDGQINELLENLLIKFDEDTYLLVLYGTGALLALWLATVVVGAIDSIPLFPKLIEVVGLGYTFWFSSRYLLFKKDRDELAAKIEELKQQVLGSKDD